MNTIDKVKQWMYYFIIGILSMIALCFLPMVGSGVGLDWITPDTVVGWIVWIVVKLIVAVLNVLIFHCFMLQAKINIKDNDKYLEAKEILRNNKVKEYIPRGPDAWNKQQYGQKGATIFITTALSTVALTQAILTFDWMAMLTYLFTIVMGLIFGIMQMKTAEDYWTDEFWQYAKGVQKDREVAKTEPIEKKDHVVCVDKIINILEPSTCDCDPITEPETELVVSNVIENSVLERPIHTSSSSTTSTNTWSKEMLLKVIKK